MSEQGAINYKPLMGTEEVAVDDKGRILFSKKKRERLGEPFVIGLGDMGCLVAYPEYAWNKLLADIGEASVINQGRQQYTRMVLGTAEDDQRFDPQGRVLIPRRLRELGQIKDKVMLVGAYERVEIWPKDQYDAFVKREEVFGDNRAEAISRAYDAMVGRVGSAPIRQPADQG